MHVRGSYITSKSAFKISHYILNLNIGVPSLNLLVVYISTPLQRHSDQLSSVVYFTTSSDESKETKTRVKNISSTL